MKKTVEIDEKLLHEARQATHAKNDTEAIRLGLEALVQKAAYDRLSKLAGTNPEAKDVPRRR